MDMRVLLDRGAIEAFVNDGEVAFSERILQNTFNDDIKMDYWVEKPNIILHAEVWLMGKFY
jgi:sucrose-6-phosphate hydrolase SacC (GH32 family)